MTIWKAAGYCCVLLLVCPLAYAQDANSGDTDENDSSERVCIYTRNIDGIDALTDEHVFITARRDEFYLFTMRRRCFGLRHAMGIAIKDATSRVCADGSADIVYRDMGRLESCGIDKIERVESKAAAEELVKQREEEKQ